MEQTKNYFKNPIQLNAESQDKLHSIIEKVRTIISITPIIIGLLLMATFVVLAVLNYEIYFSEVIASSIIFSCFLLMKLLKKLNNE